MKHKFKKFLVWTEVILWCGVIFYFSSIPYLMIEQLGVLDLILRKIAHISEYAVLSALLFRAFKTTTKLSYNKIYLYTVSLCILYAISDEIHQHFVPGRNCRILDIVIDTVGVILGIVLYIKNSKTKSLTKIVKNSINF